MKIDSALAAFLAHRTARHRDELVAAYWYLCLRGAKKFYRSGVDHADLVQIGAVGLLKAVDGYRASTGTPFEAYAWLLIVGELMHYVRDHERIMRVPRTIRALEKRFATVSESLAATLGRTPTPAEIAVELSIDIVVVDEIRLLRRGGAIVSLEASTGSPTGEPAARTAAIGIDEKLAIDVAIDDLTERERLAVLGSFAAGLSQAEIGVKLGLSQSQVSKLIKKALSKMHAQVA